MFKFAPRALPDPAPSPQDPIKISETHLQNRKSKKEIVKMGTVIQHSCRGREEGVRAPAVVLSHDSSQEVFEFVTGWGV